MGMTNNAAANATKMTTARSASAMWTKFNNARRAARQAATDYAFNARPLSPEQTAEHRRLVAVADAASDSCDAFYAVNSKAAGGLLNC
jgi:hypothetical protein